MSNFYCFFVHFSSFLIFNFGLVHYASRPFNYNNNNRNLSRIKDCVSIVQTLVGIRKQKRELAALADTIVHLSVLEHTLKTKTEQYLRSL